MNEYPEVVIDGVAYVPANHYTATVSPENRHPMQPVVAVDGVHRFRANQLVRALLDQPGGMDLNAVCRLAYELHAEEDYSQLMQLIGYSVSGYCGMDCAPDDMVAASIAASDALRGAQ